MLAWIFETIFNYMRRNIKSILFIYLIRFCFLKDNPGKKLPGACQFNTENSKLKCQNRREKQLNPSVQSCTQPSLIRESARVEVGRNETNFDRHNQNQDRDQTIRSDLPHPRLSNAMSYSYYAVERNAPTAAERNAGSSVTSAHDKECSEISRQIYNGSAEKSRMYFSEPVPDNYVQVLLVDPETSDVRRDIIMNDTKELCTEKNKSSRHVLCPRNPNPHAVLENRGTIFLRQTMDYTDLEVVCPKTEMCRIKRTNFAQFRHSAMDPTEKADKHFLRQDPSTVFSYSCDNLLGKSYFQKENNSPHRHATHQWSVENINSDQQYYEDGLGINNVDIEHDMLDKDHHSGTEDTVSTLGSLTSLKLFEATEIVTPEFFISDTGMNCEECVSMSVDQMQSSTGNTTYVQQEQQQNTCCCETTQETNSSQTCQAASPSYSKPSHTGSTAVSSRTYNDAINCGESDQRCPNAQQGNVGISRAKLKTIKLTLTVVICYVVCWAPFFVGQMWAAYDINAPYDGQFFSVIMLLASVNSCTNPWIYTIFSNSICQRTKDIFSFPCRCFAACWKVTRSSWPRKTLETPSYLQPVHDAPQKRKIFEHTSFSTFG